MIIRVKKPSKLSRSIIEKFLEVDPATIGHMRNVGHPFER
jgi:hypothetical protein